MVTVDSHTDQTPETDDRFAVALRGFGPVGLLAMVVIVAGNALVAPLSQVLVLMGVRMSRTPLRDIGFVRPESWAATIAGGLVVGVTLKFAMKAIVMPILGADHGALDDLLRPRVDRRPPVIRVGLMHPVDFLWLVNADSTRRNDV